MAGETEGRSEVTCGAAGKPDDDQVCEEEWIRMRI